MRQSFVLITVLTALLARDRHAAIAQPTGAQICLADKQLAAGKYAKCRLEAEAKRVLKDDLEAFNASLEKCKAKFAKAWQKAENAAVEAGATCEDSPPFEDVAESIRSHTGDVYSGISDGDYMYNCAVEAADCRDRIDTYCTQPQAACDSGLDRCHSDLPDCHRYIAQNDAASGWCGESLASCESNYLVARRLKTGQTTCYDAVGTQIACAGTGQDGEYQVGLSQSYTDNGDGSISDNRTGLIWEKLDDNNVGGIHDRDRSYYWGQTFQRIRVLNGDVTGCIGANDPDICCTGAGSGSCSPFLGHTDWRLPTSFELMSLVNFGRTWPAADLIFHTNCQPGCTLQTCSCSKRGNEDYYYGSDRGTPDSPFQVQYVSMGYYVRALMGDKNLAYYARAVRGGY